MRSGNDVRRGASLQLVEPALDAPKPYGIAHLREAVAELRRQRGIAPKVEVIRGGRNA